ncbi:MAG: lytic transglycosylase domain-containing protein [Ruminococcaceae bacterium]|nr:lytic transglycosylase domain-containing protein [Oscillospiraceae bacterium]
MSNNTSRRTLTPARRVLNMLLLVGMIVLLIYLVKAGANMFYKHFYPIKYSDLVEKYSEENGLDEVFVYSVISCESGFDPEAKSSVGALGLMQITEDAFEWVMFRKGETRELTFDMLTDPELNIEYGTYMLGFFKEEFGSVENILCAYHAGRGQTQKWLADERYTTDGVVTDIPFSDTAAYVSRVKKTMDIYENLYYGGK